MLHPRRIALLLLLARAAASNHAFGLGAREAAACAASRDGLSCVAGSCAWCATSRQCGTARETCAAECCVSADARSACLSTDLSGLVQRCTEALASVLVGVDATSQNPFGAEAALTGFGFSGGGARAFSTAMGWVRGLDAIKAFTKDVNVAGVSGSTWFLAPYFYSSFNDDDLVPPYLEPQDCTLTNLDSQKGFLANAPGPMLEPVLEEYVKRLASSSYGDLDDIWRDVVHALYLAPAGIGVDAVSASSPQHARDVLERNPYLNATFVFPRRQDMPKLVLVGTVLGPASLAPFGEPRKYLPLAFGAERSGTRFSTQSVEYVSSNGRSETVNVGGLSETFAFGAALLALNATERSALVAPRRRPFSLADAVGIASLAPAAVFEQDIGALDDVIPERLLWAPNDGGDEDGAKAGASKASKASKAPKADGLTAAVMSLGDGGDTENFGVVPLLQRGAKKLVIFAATNTPLAPASAWDPTTTLPSLDNCDSYVPSLFGIDSTGDREADVRNNKVFEEEAFPKLVQLLQRSQASGNGTIARLSLRTVANSLFDVPAGRKVDVVVVYLDEPARWRNALPEETLEALDDGRPFPYFPFYGTFTQLALSTRQVNLLANMATWVVRTNAHFFLD
ncbi:hypothetical protein M885DRAFT_505413 [Pelagophyceae sp. CCMP2097]|nr:hypothetical protein M885DRAFT_505413 [Pelagophyceae sp. CCMP2097]